MDVEATVSFTWGRVESGKERFLFWEDESAVLVGHHVRPFTAAIIR